MKSSNIFVTVCDANNKWMLDWLIENFEIYYLMRFQSLQLLSFLVHLSIFTKILAHFSNLRSSHLDLQDQYSILLNQKLLLLTFVDPHSIVGG